MEARVKEMEERIRKLFASIDADKDGSISRAELGLKLKQDHEVQAMLHASGHSLTNLYNQFDVDGDGSVHVGEFLWEMQAGHRDQGAESTTSQSRPKRPKTAPPKVHFGLRSTELLGLRPEAAEDTKTEPALEPEPEQAPDPEPTSRLVVSIFECRNLPKMDRFGKNDVFVTVQVDDQTVKTKVVDGGGAAPVFGTGGDGEHLTLEMPPRKPGQKTTLVVTVYDEDIASNDLIGKYTIELPVTEPDSDWTINADWHELTPGKHKGKQPAEIKLTVAWSAPETLESRVTKLFNVIDTDNSGTIDRKELADKLKQGGELHVILADYWRTPDYIFEQLNVDVDGWGRSPITLFEFLAIVTLPVNQEEEEAKPEPEPVVHSQTELALRPEPEPQQESTSRLVVSILECRNLPKTDRFGKNDIFVTVQVDDQTKRTKVVDGGGAAPVFGALEVPPRKPGQKAAMVVTVHEPVPDPDADPEPVPEETAIEVSSGTGRVENMVETGSAIDSAMEQSLREVFARADKNSDGSLTRAELILRLRKDFELATLLKLPAKVGDDDRGAFEEVFQGMDVDESSAIDVAEFVRYFSKVAATAAAGEVSEIATQGSLLELTNTGADILQPEGAPQPEPEQTKHYLDIKRQIEETYKVHNKRKLVDVEKLLVEWQGDETALLASIKQKYADDWKPDFSTVTDTAKAVLIDHRLVVAVVGGWDEEKSKAVQDVDFFDIMKMEWLTHPVVMGTRCIDPLVCATSDSRGVLVTGGAVSAERGSTYYRNTEALGFGVDGELAGEKDGEIDHGWTQLPALPKARSECVGGLLPWSIGEDGKPETTLVVMAGVEQADAVVEAEVAAQGRWKKLSSRFTKTTASTIAPTLLCKLLQVQGKNDMLMERDQTTVPAMLKSRLQAAMCVTFDGNLFVAGGIANPSKGSKSAVILSSAEMYDPSVGSWQQLPPMSLARAGAACSALPLNAVLVAGGRQGRQGAGGDVGVVSSCEVFDIEKRVWSRFPSMNVPRSNFAMVSTVLLEGSPSGVSPSILVFGGTDQTDYSKRIAKIHQEEVADAAMSSAECWDPTGHNLHNLHNHKTMGTWHNLPSMPHRRVRHGAAVIFFPADGDEAGSYLPPSEAELARLAAEREEEEAQLAAGTKELFERFDTDKDGMLSKDEYEVYLKGIGVWGTDWYTTERWKESWPSECEQMKSTVEGITWEAFEGILYGQYRKTQIVEDLAAVRALPPTASPRPRLVGHIGVCPVGMHSPEQAEEAEAASELRSTSERMVHELHSATDASEPLEEQHVDALAVDALADDAPATVVEVGGNDTTAANTAEDVAPAVGAEPDPEVEAEANVPAAEAPADAPVIGENPDAEAAPVVDTEATTEGGDAEAAAAAEAEPKEAAPMPEPFDPKIEEWGRSVFAQFDTNNKDGGLSAKELTRALKSLPWKKPKNVPLGTKFQSVDAMITAIAADGDGNIDVDQWLSRLGSCAGLAAALAENVNEDSEIATFRAEDEVAAPELEQVEAAAAANAEASEPLEEQLAACHSSIN